MNSTLWIIQVLLAAVYLLAGGFKTFNTSQAQARLPWAAKSSVNYVRFVGVTELLGALGLLLPMLTGILPWLTPLAAVGLVVVQALAAGMVHLPAREYKSVLANLVLLVLAALVAYGRFFLLPV